MSLCFWWLLIRYIISLPYQTMCRFLICLMCWNHGVYIFVVMNDQLPCGTWFLWKWYLDAVVTLASFEPEQLAVRTNKGCSRSHYPFWLLHKPAQLFPAAVSYRTRDKVPASGACRRCEGSSLWTDPLRCKKQGIQHTWIEWRARSCAPADRSRPTDITRWACKRDKDPDISESPEAVWRYGTETVLLETVFLVRQLLYSNRKWKYTWSCKKIYKRSGDKIKGHSPTPMQVL